jgi:hypothetical protein
LLGYLLEMETSIWNVNVGLRLFVGYRNIPRQSLANFYEMFVKGIWDILDLYFFVIFIFNVTYMGSFWLFVYQFIYAFPRVFYIAFVITNFSIL